MKIVLFGPSGQLGTSLRANRPKDWILIPIDEDQADFLNPQEALDQIALIKPDFVINAAAYTNVDQAEIDKDLVNKINHIAVKEISKFCNTLQIPLIHFSTDYVFDGTKGIAYSEEDTPNPLNYYGLTKLWGEEAIIENSDQFLIFRTSWLYNLNFKNFITKAFDWLGTKKEVNIVCDRISTPTWSEMLARSVFEVLQTNSIDRLFEQHSGIYHLTCQDYASRHSLTEEIYSILSPIKKLKAQRIIPVGSETFPALATRPENSALNCRKVMDTFGIKIPTWQKCLKTAITQEYD